MFIKETFHKRVSVGKVCLVLTFCFAYLTGAHAQTPATTAQDAAKSDPFISMLAKLKGGDTKINFKELRMASVDSKAEDAGQPDQDEYKKAVDAYNSKKFKAAISAGEKALAQGYLGMDAHMLMAVSYRESGNTEKFDFHKAVYLGLVNSILTGADGKSAKTAYVVIDVAEEYALLRALGLNRGSQALRTEGGHKFDVLSVTDPKNDEKRDIWFNIDAVWKGYEKMFK